MLGNYVVKASVKRLLKVRIVTPREDFPDSFRWKSELPLKVCILRTLANKKQKRHLLVSSDLSGVCK